MQSAPHAAAGPPIPTLSGLPLPAKVLVSALLLTMAFGMAGALGQIVIHDILPTFFSEPAAGKAPLSHGGQGSAGGHSMALPQDSDTLAPGGMREPSGNSGIRGDLFAGGPSSRAVAPPAAPFHDSERFVWTLKWTHIHLFGMNMIFILLGCVTLLLDLSPSARAWLIGLPFAGVLADIAAVWLKAYVSPAFFWLHIPGGGLFAAVFLFVFFRAVREMWFSRPAGGPPDAKPESRRIFRFSSLRQRLALLLLLPVAVLLTATGTATYLFASKSLLREWREATVLKLQRAAHYVDMRLAGPKEWIRFYGQAGTGADAAYLRSAILERLRAKEGVVAVRMLTESRPLSPADSPGPVPFPAHGGDGKGDTAVVVSFPETPGERPRTVSLTSIVLDGSEKPSGSLEVTLDFDHLFEAVMASGWWQEHDAFLVDGTGGILAATAEAARQLRLRDLGSAIADAVLDKANPSESGMVLGRGLVPETVSGYYRLHEAPLSLVIVAPGREIFQPILRFRAYFLSLGAITLALILLLMRSVTGHTVHGIKEASRAAQSIARGNFNTLLPEPGGDEVGELIRSFNAMSSQLQERMRLKEAIGLAREVQQHLLPKPMPRWAGLDIAATIRYCDETGGDYYDYFDFGGADSERLGVAVGDVSGHDISSALLMTTARALLRGRLDQSTAIPETIGAVNRLLCRDTERNGNFMTLFFLLVDRRRRELRWVRAGHDPAILYDASGDRIVELAGQGIAMGVDPAWEFREYVHENWLQHQMVIIGTDGIWEAENGRGELFGKQRFHRVVRECANLSAGEVVSRIVAAVEAFRGTKEQLDDLTVVVVKPETAVA